jgi:hypothetical protein
MIVHEPNPWALRLRVAPTRIPFAIWFHSDVTPEASVSTLHAPLAGRARSGLQIRGFVSALAAVSPMLSRYSGQDIDHPFGIDRLMRTATPR